MVGQAGAGAGAPPASGAEGGAGAAGAVGEREGAAREGAAQGRGGGQGFIRPGGSCLEAREPVRRGHTRACPCASWACSYRLCASSAASSGCAERGGSVGRCHRGSAERCAGAARAAGTAGMGAPQGPGEGGGRVDPAGRFWGQHPGSILCTNRRQAEEA